MSTRIFILAVVLATVACQPDKKERVDIDDLRFATTDASEIFFKNIRRSEYLAEELPEAKLAVYRNEKLADGSHPVNPALIIHWGNDQAFLILEKATHLPDELTFLLRGKLQTDTIYFDAGFQRRHAEVAVRLYNGLLDEKEIFLLYNQDLIPLFREDEAQLFRRMVYDFLRLVELR